MDLFANLVDNDRLHPNYRSILVPEREAERILLSEWAKNFPDRDGKLAVEFQTTFNSTFWEIYLYAVFKTYGFDFDWSHSSPDFVLAAKGFEFTIEATTANSAQDKPNEWDKFKSPEEIKKLPLNEINREAIIRLSNSINYKYRQYQEKYSRMEHVMDRPFILAIAPFEQPYFNLQYDRPIRALLYDYYIDEEEYLADPSKFPMGMTGKKLGVIRKDNGSPISLGLFNEKEFENLSAVVFSCTATWGKLSVMSNNPMRETLVTSLWATEPNGAPKLVKCNKKDYHETILDGLQIYHNPFAAIPANPSLFRAPRVVQHYFDHGIDEWCYEGTTSALQFREVWSTKR